MTKDQNFTEELLATLSLENIIQKAANELFRDVTAYPKAFQHYMELYNDGVQSTLHWFRFCPYLRTPWHHNLLSGNLQPVTAPKCPCCSSTMEPPDFLWLCGNCGTAFQKDQIIK